MPAVPTPKRLQPLVFLATTTYDGGSTHRVSGWMVPVGSENGAANGESVVIYGMEAGASGGQGWAVNHNYDQMSKGAFGGTWFAKLAGSYKITPWYKVTLQGLYIGDTTKNGNTFGNALKSDGTPRDDKTIGIEIDWLNEFEIYKNLTFKLFGGYMFAGEAMNMNTGLVIPTPTSRIPGRSEQGSCILSNGRVAKKAVFSDRLFFTLVSVRYSVVLTSRPEFVI